MADCYASKEGFTVKSQHDRHCPGGCCLMWGYPILFWVPGSLWNQRESPDSSVLHPSDMETWNQGIGAKTCKDREVSAESNRSRMRFGEVVRGREKRAREGKGSYIAPLCEIRKNLSFRWELVGQAWVSPLAGSSGKIENKRQQPTKSGSRPELGRRGKILQPSSVPWLSANNGVSWWPRCWTPGQVFAYSKPGGSSHKPLGSSSRWGPFRGWGFPGILSVSMQASHGSILV